LKPQYWPAPYSKEGKTQREKKRKETPVEAHGRKNRIFWTRGRRQMKTK
jgi:IS1 family transposase